jgi:hypothetical protein
VPLCVPARHGASWHVRSSLSSSASIAPSLASRPGPSPFRALLDTDARTCRLAPVLGAGAPQPHGVLPSPAPPDSHTLHALGADPPRCPELSSGDSSRAAFWLGVSRAEPWSARTSSESQAKMSRDVRKTSQDVPELAAGTAPPDTSVTDRGAHASWARWVHARTRLARHASPDARRCSRDPFGSGRCRQRVLVDDPVPLLQGPRRQL